MHEQQKQILTEENKWARDYILTMQQQPKSEKK
jgi:hypothetical protein